MHMDIVFGPDIALGNIHYGLLFTDRFSRLTYLYSLQNLTSDIRKQVEYFFAHLFPTLIQNLSVVKNVNILTALRFMLMLLRQIVKIITALLSVTGKP